MGEENRYVLAMYDVRGKQDFIFRTDKLKEIVGASWLIRDVFEDYLFPAAGELSEKGIYTYHPDTPDKDAFTVEGFKAHLAEGYLGEVVYNGGGNFLVLFRDEETFRDVTYAFTRDVMKATGTLRVLASCTGPVDFDNYKEDSRRLYALHRKKEATEAKIDPWSCLPIVQVDRKTSMPLIAKDKTHGDLSRETFAKRKKFEKEERKRREGTLAHADAVVVQNTNVFDEMLAKKGESSQIAVVYIDGNSMGAKVQQVTNGLSSYEESVAALRAFSARIQRIYVEEGVGQVITDSESGKYRIVVSAGDEINFVVRADEALACARGYLERLQETGEDDSACAGIAVFHSHAPYADAYRIAEEACESGKQKMKELELQTACFVDFHICQGATGMSLEEIREDEKLQEISRPWLISTTQPEKAKGLTHIEEVDRLAALFGKLGRSNVKSLPGAVRKSAASVTLELMRIYAHLGDAMKKETAKGWEWLGLPGGIPKNETIPPEKQRLIYDVVIAYDLWFSGKEEEETR